MQRLITRSQFRAVLAGSIAARTPHFALHCAALSAASSGPDATSPNDRSGQVDFPIQDVWIGALVPKRWARRAVTRNAIKRQIYTMSKDFESTLAQAAHLVRLRSGFDPVQFPSASSEALKSTVRMELQQLFQRAGARPAVAVPGGAV